MRKTKLVPSIKLWRQRSCRIKFSSCSHLHNDFKPLITKQPQILSIYSIIIWHKKTGTGWCISFWQICIFVLFRKEKYFVYPFVNVFLLLVFSKTRDNKGSSKVCHSNSCFAGFCAAHCTYGPQILYAEAVTFFLKNWRKRSRRKWKGCFGKVREK